MTTGAVDDLSRARAGLEVEACVVSRTRCWLGTIWTCLISATGRSIVRNGTAPVGTVRAAVHHWHRFMRVPAIRHVDHRAATLTPQSCRPAVARGGDRASRP